ncbi:hypothetical protein DQ04_04581040 [Trypanosoma grayi]|uniref:hypothetical protein n=1 Tax=Trypanosoma grayi TaxID=71804 RepID=UPI0004F40F4E|nr:hypothetical protein DQ04_04581040 [Trypanosoma grayi]KEG09822.1 hypothetical protein DQ04_04581040 [Trypanosoma grayi]
MRRYAFGGKGGSVVHIAASGSFHGFSRLAVGPLKGQSDASQFLNYTATLFQQRHYAIGANKVLQLRNITENTLADTPSGYIQDPANHPKQMVTYQRLSSEAQAALDALEREEDLMQRDELAYSGYTTIPIQEWKEVVLNSRSTQQELETACDGLQQALRELVGQIGSTVEKRSTRHTLHSLLDEDRKTVNDDVSSDPIVVSEDDCNHVRYVIALALRRLNQYDMAEKICMEILSSDHSNCDALECLIEIFTGTEQPEKIHLLFDQLERWDYEDEEMRPKDGKDSPDTTITETGGNKLKLVEMTMVLLTDVIIEAASLHYVEHGEGSTSRYFLEVLSSISRSVGPRYTSLLIESLFRALDEQHFAARFNTCSNKETENTIGLVISFLKMLLARDMWELSEDPVRFEFHLLSKLHAALRFNGRKHESYKVCERLIKLYRSKSARYDISTEKRKVENEEGLLDDLEPAYKTAFFQYVEDRALDSLVVGKRLCVQAIEEFPDDASPWETLALILHKEDPIKGLDDAIVAAKKAFSLDPRNLRIILTLANFYKAQKRYNLHGIMMDRYRRLDYLLESEASEEEINAALEEIENIDEMIPRETEPDEVSLQSAAMQEHMERMEVAQTYSMPIDKEERLFGRQPMSVPMLDPSINAEKPKRLVDNERDLCE